MRPVLKVFIPVFLMILVLPSFCTGKTKSGSPSITALKGHNFAVYLRSNPTTGYSWQLQKNIDRKYLRLMTSQYNPPKTKMLGAPGEEVWIFKAQKEGKTTLYFSYQRPWEKDKPPDETRNIQITIK